MSVQAAPVAAPSPDCGAFTLCGRGLRWTADTESAGKVFSGLCANNLITEEASESKAELTLSVTERPLPPQAASTLLSETPRVTVTKTDAHAVVLSLKGFAAVIAADQRSACLHLGADAPNLSLKEQQFALSLLMAWLLQATGLTCLHAAALSRDGQGLVLTAVSGSGKSTTAWTLVAAGWQLLADDIVFIDPSTSPPMLWPLARGLSAEPQLADRSTAWRVLDPTLINGKLLLDPVLPTLPGPTALHWLIFPTVTRRERSSLKKLSSLETLVQLLPAAGGILTGLPSAEGKTQQLSALCTQIPGLRLGLGEEVFANPKAMAALFSGLG